MLESRRRCKPPAPRRRNGWSQNSGTPPAQASSWRAWSGPVGKEVGRRDLTAIAIDCDGRLLGSQLGLARDQVPRKGQAVGHQVAAFPAQIGQLTEQRIVAAERPRSENMIEAGREIAQL